jgi:hypothetical protein
VDWSPTKQLKACWRRRVPQGLQAVVARSIISSYNSYYRSWNLIRKDPKTPTITDTPRRKTETEHAADPTLDSLQLLLREAGRYPLLKPSEETLPPRSE